MELIRTDVIYLGEITAVGGGLRRSRDTVKIVHSGEKLSSVCFVCLPQTRSTCHWLFARTMPCDRLTPRLLLSGGCLADPSPKDTKRSWALIQPVLGVAGHQMLTGLRCVLWTNRIQSLCSFPPFRLCTTCTGYVSLPQASMTPNCSFARLSSMTTEQTSWAKPELNDCRKITSRVALTFLPSQIQIQIQIQAIPPFKILTNGLISFVRVSWRHYWTTRNISKEKRLRIVLSDRDSVSTSKHISFI